MQTSMIIGVIVAALLGFVVMTYNALVKLRILCENAWSDIDVQLKKRHDLIPNIVNTVKGYASHEQETLDKVIQARNQAVGAKNVGDQIEAESAISSLIPKIFALAEQYPDLKANTNFMELQKTLSEVEESLSQARRYYNAVVRDFNTKQALFPSNIVANMFSFKTNPFFEVEDEAKSAPQVQF